MIKVIKPPLLKDVTEMFRVRALHSYLILSVVIFTSSPLVVLCVSFASSCSDLCLDEGTKLTNAANHGIPQIARHSLQVAGRMPM